MANTRDNYFNFTHDSFAAEIAYSRQIVANGYGDILLDLPQANGKDITIRINQVWFFPVNLSISALKSQDMTVIFEIMPGIINSGLYKRDQAIGTVKKIGNRYHLLTNVAAANATKSSNATASAISASTISRSYER
jgi:hypothetical protein